jgi:aminoglycoside phosphotransferase (APT) family kinase protein
MEALVRSGLLTTREIVDAEVVVRPAGGRRGRTARIERTRGRSWFLKRPDPRSSPDRRDREEIAYRRLAGSGHLIARHVPELLGVGPYPGSLVLELLEPATNLAQCQARSPQLAVAAGAAAGRALAILHGAPAGLLGEEGRLPPAFALARAGVDLYASLSAADLACLAVAQEEGVCDLLDDLARDWSPAALIHGDVRPANVLIDDRDEARPHVWLVDWEHAGRGDPRWDVGCLVAHLLSPWVSSVTQATDWEAAPRASAAQRPLEALTPAIVAAWRAYAGARADEFGDPVHELLVTMRMAGACLVEIAMSLGQDAPMATDEQLMHLQAAHNLLLRPAEGADMLGLTPWAALASETA